MKKWLDTALWIGHAEFQEVISELIYDFLLIKSKHETILGTTIQTPKPVNVICLSQII